MKFIFSGSIFKGSNKLTLILILSLILDSQIFLTLCLKFLITWPHLEKRAEGLIRNTGQKLRIKSMIRSVAPVFYLGSFYKEERLIF